jgi:hypothetical protein
MIDTHIKKLRILTYSGLELAFFLLGTYFSWRKFLAAARILFSNKAMVWHEILRKT